MIAFTKHVFAVATVSLFVVRGTDGVCSEEFKLELGKYGSGPVAYNETLARKDWPRFRDSFQPVDTLVRNGQMFPGDAGMAWYSNLPGLTDRVTFQYAVDVSVADATSRIPGLCGDTCPYDNATATNGFSIVPEIGPDRQLYARYVLPTALTTESMFYTLDATRLNTLRMEVRLNTAGLSDGIFRMWVDGLMVKEELRMQYRYYDDIFVRSLMIRASGPVALNDFEYWVGECEVPVQHVLLTDVWPGTEVVTLDDQELTDVDYVLGDPLEVSADELLYGDYLEYDPNVDIFEEYPERGDCETCMLGETSTTTVVFAPFR